MTPIQAMFVGIDVSKDKLDVCLLPEGRSWSSPNHAAGIAQLVETLSVLQPGWIILEPTGGYELPLVEALLKAGLRVSRPHVTKVSFHARGRRLSKTDQLDAQALAHYGQCYQQELRAYRSSPAQRLLHGLWQRREQLVKMRTEEKNRLSHAELPAWLAQSIERSIAFLSEQIQQVETLLEAEIEKSPALTRKRTLLESMVGVSRLTALGLLALLPELGDANRKEIAALVGVAPMEKSSGKQKGKSNIRGGRFGVRRLLYMAALSAIRYNPPLAQFYQHLRTQGKPGKKALVAIMHKMLRILNAMLKSGHAFQSASQTEIKT
jgi:transposase